MDFLAQSNKQKGIRGLENKERGGEMETGGLSPQRRPRADIG